MYIRIGVGNGGVPVLSGVGAPAPQENTAGDPPPELYNALIQQESRGNPYAVSPKGAFGRGQTMPGTFAKPGFGIAPGDPSKPRLAESERISKQYFNAMWKKYNGNIDYALAAYNWGPGNTDKWIAKGADPARLPRETQGYIRNIKANYLSGTGATPPPNMASSLGSPQNMPLTAGIAAQKLANKAPAPATAITPSVQGKATKAQPFGPGFFNPGKAMQRAFAQTPTTSFSLTPIDMNAGGLTPDQWSLINRLGSTYSG